MVKLDELGLSLAGIEDCELGSESVFELSTSFSEKEKAMVVAKEWMSPKLKPKRSLVTSVKITTGLASVMKDEL
ncbi:hypothetical protein TB2_031016 [Malus domestica]